MKKVQLLCALVCVLTAYSLWSQEAAGGKPGMQAQVADLKKSMAENQAKLKTYQWTQSTVVSIKGSTKKDEEARCQYGPDGKVVKTPMGTPMAQQEAPKQQRGGLRGRIVEKKVDEMKDYVERLKSLISHYAPPDPERIQSASAGGKADLIVQGGVATVSIPDYYKTGDKVAIAFDTSTKKLRSYDVNTYLDDPKDIVTLTNQFSTLPDGTSYLQQTVLDSKEKQIQVTTTNSNYVPLAK